MPPDGADPARRLRRIAAAVRVHFPWWGVHRSLTARQEGEAGLAYDADARLLTTGNKLLDTRHNLPPATRWKKNCSIVSGCAPGRVSMMREFAVGRPRPPEWAVPPLHRLVD